MPYTSSPTAYPTSSSPIRADSPRKKRKVDELVHRSPLKPVQANLCRGPFVEDESDEDSQYLTDQKRKTPMTTKGRNEDYDTSLKDISTDLDATNLTYTIRLKSMTSTETQTAHDIEITETAPSHQTLLLKAQTCSG